MRRQGEEETGRETDGLDEGGLSEMDYILQYMEERGRISYLELPEFEHSSEDSGDQAAAEAEIEEGDGYNEVEEPEREDLRQVDEGEEEREQVEADQQEDLGFDDSAENLVRDVAPVDDVPVPSQDELAGAMSFADDDGQEPEEQAVDEDAVDDEPDAVEPEIEQQDEMELAEQEIEQQDEMELAEQEIEQQDEMELAEQEIEQQDEMELAEPEIERGEYEPEDDTDWREGSEFSWIGESDFGRADDSSGYLMEPVSGGGDEQWYPEFGADEEIAYEDGGVDVSGQEEEADLPEMELVDDEYPGVQELPRISVGGQTEMPIHDEAAIGDAEAIRGIGGTLARAIYDVSQEFRLSEHLQDMAMRSEDAMTGMVEEAIENVMARVNL